MSHDERLAMNGGDGVRQSSSRARSWLGYAGRFVLALLILGAGGAISVYWLRHRPKATRRRPAAQATLVAVAPAQADTHQIVVRAMGTVVPARSIQLASRVSGEVVEVSPAFQPGGRFQSGALVLKIDPSDYELAIEQSKAELAKRSAEAEQAAGQVSQAEVDIELAGIQIERSRLEVKQRETAVVQAASAFTVEAGQQSVAKREYELLGQTIEAADRELVLRQPQLRAAQADQDAALASQRVAESDTTAAEASKRLTEVAKRTAEASEQAAKASLTSAAAALRKAQLDLERTRVVAPFNAMVLVRDVDLGSQVNTGTQLASLVGTDEYWVQVSVAVDQLRWINVPGQRGDHGSQVRVFCEAAWGQAVSRLGTVRGLMTELEPEGRMAQLLVVVEDPLGLGTEENPGLPLILGSYVRVEIEGKELADVVRIERSALRNGDQVWVMGSDSTLEVRDVHIAWGGAEHVYISTGLWAGDLLVTSDLGTPVPGMALRTSSESGARPAASPAAIATRAGSSAAKRDAPAESGPQSGSEG